MPHSDDGKDASLENDIKIDPTVVEEQEVLADYDYTEEESRAVARKLDWHILPYLWWAYIFNSLDRSNVSNAKSDGMTTDLNFPNEGYSLMLTIFFIPFCLLGIPGVMLTRKVGPRWTVPGYMIGWGSMAAISAACKNFGSILGVRILLGAFEAGFAASLVFYLTTFYTRGELGRRVAVFYSCNALSGAFSGLIAYGVFQMESSLHGWQILFLIEGAFTVGFGMVVAVMLPWSVDSARFLTARQREVGRLRILKDGSAETGTKFNMSAFFKPVKDFKFWVFAGIGLSYGTATSMASNFLTQIVSRFGYSTVKTNLFTVAPYVTGTIVLLITSYSSDHYRERAFHLASALVWVIVGCLILVAIPVSSVGVGYFAVFLITAGAFTPSVLFHTWHQNNDPTEDGRAFRVAALTFLANSGGFVSSNIFLDKWSPAYHIPLAITCGMEGIGVVLIVGLGLWMRWDNKRRNQEQGVQWSSEDVPTEVLKDGPKNPSYRHFV
ncbi:hypothetical protein B9479_005529 [Cryptococcus floricola]|uniref:Major facilitator superfamily (MFS) profile domain-containing protein n=1 Tax=Cryptococcus floricola TaxID=2591691 RepID=A0A5D3ASN9_9TREE|nr:hypothetical protein B9479_005529 [Cryptococcus floricola]